MQLRDLVYKTSEYSTFTIYEPKEREIKSLPYKERVVKSGMFMNLLNLIFSLDLLKILMLVYFQKVCLKKQ